MSVPAARSNPTVGPLMRAAPRGPRPPGCRAAPGFGGPLVQVGHRLVAGLADLLPSTMIHWLLLVQAVAIAVSGVYLQSVVTPLSDSRAADVTPLRALVSGCPVLPAAGTLGDGR